MRIWYDYTHFTDEKTKAEKLNSGDQDQVSGRWYNLNLNLGSSTCIVSASCADPNKREGFAHKTVLMCFSTFIFYLDYKQL